MYEKIEKLLKQEYLCPHCESKLTLCNVPPVHVGDGLGWGSEYLYICLNNDCPLFVKGWANIENNYGHVGSYRYMRLPDSNESYNMMVAGKDAFTGSIIDLEEIKKQDKRYHERKEAVASLDTCVEEKNIQPALYVLLDKASNTENRKKAIKVLGELNDPACIDALRNHDFEDSHMEQDVNMTISGILSSNFLKECPFCAELIKVRALVCKHCQKELA